MAVDGVRPQRARPLCRRVVGAPHNPISSALAVEGVRSLISTLPRLVADGQDMAARPRDHLRYLPRGGRLRGGRFRTAPQGVPRPRRTREQHRRAESDHGGRVRDGDDTAEDHRLAAAGGEGVEGAEQRAGADQRQQGPGGGQRGAQAPDAACRTEPVEPVSDSGVLESATVIVRPSSARSTSAGAPAGTSTFACTVYCPEGRTCR